MSIRCRLTRLGIQEGADRVLAAGEWLSPQWCYHSEADALLGGSICIIVRLNGPALGLFR